jgi:acetyl esterase/lipase
LSECGNSQSRCSLLRSHPARGKPMKPKLWMFFVTLALGVSTATRAPALTSNQEVVQIWSGAPPGSETWNWREVRENFGPPSDPRPHPIYRNVVNPTLTVYRPAPARRNGTAVIVCPGGAWHFLAWDFEGTDIAEWLAERGVTAFVLKYRLIRTPEKMNEFMGVLGEFIGSVTTDFDQNIRAVDVLRRLSIEDGRQAVRYVRANGPRWGIDPNRIGIMGFSAGAAVTMGVAKNHDVESAPNFAASIYGLEPENLPVPQDAPPLFIVATQSDEQIPVGNSVRIFQAWTAAGKQAELHLFDRGPHGFARQKQGLPVDRWTQLFEAWLRSRGLIGNNTAVLAAPRSEN